jgi:hypothetical protein
VFGIGQLGHKCLKFWITIIGDAISGRKALNHRFHGTRCQQRYLLGVHAQVGIARASCKQIPMLLREKISILISCLNGQFHYLPGRHDTQPFLYITRVQICSICNGLKRPGRIEGVHDIEKTGLVSNSHGKVQGTEIQNIGQFFSKGFLGIGCVFGHEGLPNESIDL